MAIPVCPVCGSAAADPYPTPCPDPLVRCRGCRTRFVHPPPGEAALRARYDDEHAGGKWSALFAAADPEEPRRRARLLASLHGGASGARLLDVGCGDGRFLAAAADAGWAPVGLELSLAALRPAPTFAAITFWDVLEHLPDPGSALRAARALLAPGGVIALSLPSAAGTEALVSGARWRYHDLAAYGHLVHVGPEQVARLLAGAGLVPVHRETRGSVDLRDLLGDRAGRGPLAPATWLLDRASGVLARLAEPALRGNTLLVVARSAAPGGDAR